MLENNEDMENIKIVERELEAIYVDQAKGAQIRSKVNW